MDGFRTGPRDGNSPIFSKWYQCQQWIIIAFVAPVTGPFIVFGPTPFYVAPFFVPETTNYDPRAARGIRFASVYSI